MNATMRRLLALIGVCAVVLALALVPTPPRADASTITTPGPLTSVVTSPTLNCSVNHIGDTSPEWYGGTACGTFASLNGTLFGPPSVPAGGSASPLTGWTPVSQTSTTGSGTAASPYSMTTVVRSASGVLFTQTDTYIVGNEFYDTSLVILNNSGVQQSGTLYTAGDCYLSNSDVGYGKVFGTSPACSVSTAPGSRVEQLIPRTGGNNYIQAGYGTVWAAVGSQRPLPDTCECLIYRDNGMGISWPLNLAVAASATYEWTTAFSPTGEVPLSVSATAHFPTVLPGGVDGYTVRVSNPNVADVVLNEITVTLPPGVTYTPGSTTGATSSDPTIAGQVLTFAGPFSVPTNGSVSVDFAVTESTVPGVYTISADASSPSSTVTPISGAAPVTVLAVTDLAITKTASTGTAVAGGPAIIFTLTVTNNGPGTAQNVRVVDTIPAGMSFSAVGSTPGCFVLSGEVRCTTPDLAPGASSALTVALTAGAAISGGRTNTALVTADVDDTNLDNNQASVPFTVERRVDVSVTKSAAPTTVTAGGQVTFSIRVANGGPSSADVRASDVLPAGMTALSFSGTGCSLVGSPNCNLTLTPGQSTILTLVASVAPTADAGVLVNTAKITTPQIDASTADNVATAAVTVTRAADVSVVKELSGAAVAGGAALYRLVVTNAGPSAARGVVITDTVPDGTTFDPARSSSGCTLAGSEVTCAVGSLGPNGDVEIALAFTTPASTSAATVIENTATVVSVDPDPVPANNTSSTSDEVTRLVDVSVVKTPVVDPVPTGGAIAFDVVVSNSGPSDASDVVVDDGAIGNVVWDGATGTAGASVTCEVLAGNVSCTIPDLPRGASSTIRVTGTVDVGTDPNAILTNTATATPAERDSQPADNTASASVNLTRTTGLEISKSDGGGGHIAGETITYTLSAVNRGPSLATGAELIDELPVAITAPEFSAPPGVSCSLVGAFLTCDLGDLTPDPAGSAPIVVTVTGTLSPDIANGSVLLNSATVTDDVGGEDSATATTTVQRASEVRVEKAPSALIATAGGELSWTVIVTNDGPSTVEAPIIVETPDPGFTITSMTGAVCDLPSRTCSIGALEPDGSVTIVVTGTISVGYPAGPLSNKATVLNPQGPDSTDEATVDVEHRSALSIDKSALSPSVVAGGSIEYSLVVSNAGPSLAEDATAVDMLPAGFTFDAASSSPGCAAVGQEVTCSLGTLGVGGTSALIIAADVAADVPAGLVTNTATAQSSSITDPAAVDSADTQVTSEADLALTKTASSAAAGEETTWTISVTNLGPSAAVAPIVTDTIENEMTIREATASDGSVCDVVGQLVTCGLGDIPVNGVTTVEVTVLSAPDAVPDGEAFTTVQNTAQVTTSSSDPFQDNNTGSATATLVAFSDIVTTKTGPATAIAGGDIAYSLTASNAGPSTATHVDVIDHLDPREAFDPTTSDPACSLTNAGTNEVTCSVPLLEVDQAASFTIGAHIDPTVGDGTTVLNVAVGRADQPDRVPQIPATVTTTITAIADLAVTKQVTAEAVAGTPVTYTVVVTNNGPSTALNVNLTDIGPATGVGGGLTGGLKGLPDCPVLGVRYQCGIPSLDPGQSLTLSVPVTTDPAAPGGTVIDNTVTVGGSVTDDVLSNNSASARLVLTSESALELSKSPSVAEVSPGGTVDWTLLLTNTGPSVASNAHIRDALPPYLASAGTPDGCVISDQVIDCVVGDLPPGGSAAVTVSTSVAADAPGALSNTATATADDAAEVSASATVSVVPLIPPPTPTPNPAGGGGGPLANTGLDVTAALMLSTGLIVLGALGLTRRRRMNRRTNSS